jgi:lichenan operon transcriptional antiterminator
MYMEDIFAVLSQEEYRSADSIANQIGVSEKTVRKRIKGLRSALLENGADIIAKVRFGYKLVIIDETLFQNFLDAEGQEKIPEAAEERVQFLLAYLINRNEYIKIDDLCEFLYTSKTTISQTIKSVENILAPYHIVIERKANYGIRILGEEYNIRQLMCDYFVKRDNFSGLIINKQKAGVSTLAKLIWGLLVKYDIHLSEIAFENFVEYVYVATKRMGRNNYLSDSYENIQALGIIERSFIDELIKELESGYHITYTENEKNYLTLYLEGKHIIGNANNFVIQEHIDLLVIKVLDLLYREYHMDFRNNFKLRMLLNQHLVPFDIRMKYSIPLKNPLLTGIKEKYCLAYEMALKATAVLSEYYGKPISEDETGYLALIFALTLEETKSNMRSNILIVCNSGKSALQLIKFKYERTFSDYINEMYVCDLIGLEKFDFTKVDYIFTTVPIVRDVPLPVMEVGVFLENSDVRAVADVLKRGSRNFLETFYTEERFITDISSDTKVGILKELCGIIKKNELVDPDFYELVMERESYVQMNYGNYITVPHPSRIASEITFVYVAVLKKPVEWNGFPVQVVLLTSIGRKEDVNRQNFYEVTARFAFNSEAVSELIKNPHYEVLMQLLE